jgi:hypothetical protein
VGCDTWVNKFSTAILSFVKERFLGGMNADSIMFSDDYAPRAQRRKLFGGSHLSGRLTALLAWLESMLRV